MGSVLLTPDTRLCLQPFLSVPAIPQSLLKKLLPALSGTGWALRPGAHGGDVEARWSPDTRLPAFLHLRSQGQLQWNPATPDLQPQDLGSSNVQFIRCPRRPRRLSKGMMEELGQAWLRTSAATHLPAWTGWGGGGCPGKTLSLSLRTHFLSSFIMKTQSMAGPVGWIPGLQSLDP